MSLLVGPLAVVADSVVAARSDRGPFLPRMRSRRRKARGVRWPSRQPPASLPTSEGPTRFSPDGVASAGARSLQTPPWLPLSPAPEATCAGSPREPVGPEASRPALDGPCGAAGAVDSPDPGMPESLRTSPRSPQEMPSAIIHCFDVHDLTMFERRTRDRAPICDEAQACWCTRR